MDGKTILPRGEVPEEFTWDLSDVFASDDKWSEELEALKAYPERMAAYAGNRVVTERSGQEVEAVLLLEETDYEYHRWRVLEPPALASDTTWLARAHPDRQAGARYRVIVRQGWLGDFAIMPGALRAAARVAE